jgi:nitrogen regulatory protein PII
MKRVKRLEIVVDTLAVPKVLEALEAAGLSGWTVVRDVTGRGDRGLRAGDELTGVAGNGYVLAACEPEQLARVAEAVRPILRTFGGVCLVSDAEWLLH